MRKNKIKRHPHLKSGLPPGTLIYTGDRAANPAKIRTVAFDTTSAQVLEKYTPLLKSSNQCLWVDIRGLTDIPLIQKIGEDFQIHPLALEDVLNTRQRSKLEEYDPGFFIVLPNIRFDKTSLELNYEQISIFFTNNEVVTFQEDPDDTLEKIVDRIHDESARIRKKKADYLVYTIMDTIIDRYFLALEDVEDAILEIEFEIYSEHGYKNCKGKLFTLKHTLNQFRQRTLPLREVVNRLMRTSSPTIMESDTIYLRDVADHIAQVQDQLEGFREQLFNLEALYHAEVTNRMNNVMKLLTVISTIFIPLSFVAGVYGMNFEHMPELKWRYGYFIVLGSMFMIMTGMLIYFRKKNWI
jgi:magnesium transporter